MKLMGRGIHGTLPPIRLSNLLKTTLPATLLKLHKGEDTYFSHTLPGASPNP